MSRALVNIFGLLACLTLAACTATAPAVTAPVEPVAKAPPILPVQRWLRWQDTVSTMSAEQLSTAVEGTAEPSTPNQSFYYGLLRQQSDAYDGWVRARDIFRQLTENEELTRGERRLAALLERYNQSRINWYQSREVLRAQHVELEAKVAVLQQQNRLLEQKIKAITELEATISTRMED